MNSNKVQQHVNATRYLLRAGNRTVNRVTFAIVAPSLIAAGYALANIAGLII